MPLTKVLRVEMVTKDAKEDKVLKVSKVLMVQQLIRVLLVILVFKDAQVANVNSDIKVSRV